MQLWSWLLSHWHCKTAFWSSKNLFLQHLFCLLSQVLGIGFGIQCNKYCLGDRLQESVATGSCPVLPHSSTFGYWSNCLLKPFQLEDEHGPETAQPSRYPTHSLWDIFCGTCARFSAVCFGATCDRVIVKPGQLHFWLLSNWWLSGQTPCFS